MKHLRVIAAQRLPHFLQHLVTELRAETMQSRTESLRGQIETGAGARCRLFHSVPGQVGPQHLEAVRLALGLVFGLETSQAALDQVFCPLAMENDVGRGVLGCKLSLIADLSLIELQVGMGRLAFGGVQVNAAIAEEAAEGDKQQGAQPSVFGLGGGKDVGLVHRSDKALDGVLGFMRRKVGAPGKGIEGKPIGFPEFFERAATVGFIIRTHLLDQGPAGGWEFGGRSCHKVNNKTKWRGQVCQQR